MDMVNLQKSETQPRYALVVIDIFSKLGEALPMNNKDINSVYDALQAISKRWATLCRFTQMTMERSNQK